MALCHPVMLWVMSVSVVEAQPSLPAPLCRPLSASPTLPAPRDRGCANRQCSQPRGATSPRAESREGLSAPGDNKNLLVSVGVTLGVCHDVLRGQSSASAVLGKDLDWGVSVCAGGQGEGHSLCRTG